MKLDSYFLSTRPRQSDHRFGSSKTIVTSGTDDTSVLTEDLLEEDVDRQLKNKRAKDGVSFLGNMFTVDNKSNGRGKSSSKIRRAKHKNEGIDSDIIKPRKSKKSEKPVHYEDFSGLYANFSHDLRVERGPRAPHTRKKKTKASSNHRPEKCTPGQPQDSERVTSIGTEVRENISSPPNNSFLDDIALHPLTEFTLHPLTDYPFDESQENKYKCDLFPEHQFKILDMNKFQNSDKLFTDENFPPIDFSQQKEVEIEEDMGFAYEIFNNDVIVDYWCKDCQKMALGSIGCSHIVCVCNRPHDVSHNCYLQLQLIKDGDKSDTQSYDMISTARAAQISKVLECKDCTALDKTSVGLNHISKVCRKVHDSSDNCYLQLQFKGQIDPLTKA